MRKVTHYELLGHVQRAEHLLTVETREEWMDVLRAWNEFSWNPHLAPGKAPGVCDLPRRTAEAFDRR